jgi:hypothetical protein
MSFLRIIGGAFLCIGLLTLALAAFFGYRTYRLVKWGATAPGVVIENVMEERVDIDREDHSRTVTRTYRPKVRFLSPSGEEMVFVSSVGFGRPAYGQGEAVEVLYDSAHPQEAQIKTFWSLWLGPILAGLMGVIFSLLGIGILRWLSRVRGIGEVAHQASHR